MKPTESIQPIESRVSILEIAVTDIRDELRQMSADQKSRASDLDQKIDKIIASNSEKNQWSWPTISAIAVIVGMICTACVAYVNMRIAPIEGSQNTAISERAGLAANLLRMEDDRRRDNDKMDERLQREMRQLNETVVKGLEGQRDQLSLEVKRIDDVTERDDRRREDERHELMEYRALIANKVLGGK